MRSNYEFKINDSVRIADGPFEGRVVDVRSIRSGKAHILMELLGTVQDVEIPLDKLEKVA